MRARSEGESVREKLPESKWVLRLEEPVSEIRREVSSDRGGWTGPYRSRLFVWWFHVKYIPSGLLSVL